MRERERDDNDLPKWALSMHNLLINAFLQLLFCTYTYMNRKSVGMLIMECASNSVLIGTLKNCGCWPCGSHSY